MKTLTFALLATLAASTAHADGLDLSPQKTAELDRAHHRVVKGQVLTGLAIGFLATGMALGIAGAVEQPHGHDGGLGLSVAGLNIGSALTTVAGIGLAAGGIPTWVLGARAEKRVAISPTATGLSLRF